MGTDKLDSVIVCNVVEDNYSIFAAKDERKKYNINNPSKAGPSIRKLELYNYYDNYIEKYSFL